MLKEFDIKPVLTSVKNPKADAPVERLDKVMLNMLVTKNLENKVFDYIYPWGETLSYIACEIRASYHSTIMATTGQAVFDRYMLFNLTSVVHWRVVTAANQRQVDIDNVREKAKRVTHEYDIDDQVYMEMTGIWHKLDYRKQVPYRITEVFKNGTVRVQCGQVNGRINIRRLKPNFVE